MVILFLLFKSHADNLDEAMKGMQLGILIGYEGERRARPNEIFNVADYCRSQHQRCGTWLCNAYGCHLQC